MLNISTLNRPRDGGRYDRFPGAALSTYDTAERLYRTQPSMEKSKNKQNKKNAREILDRFNLLCLDEKEKTYYKAYDGCKLTIDLTLANLMIAPE